MGDELVYIDSRVPASGEARREREFVNLALFFCFLCQNRRGNPQSEELLVIDLRLPPFPPLFPMNSSEETVDVWVLLSLLAYCLLSIV